MGHLTCYTHSKRSMVLSDGQVYHRSNSEKCKTDEGYDTRVVSWGEKEFISFDIADGTVDGLSTAKDYKKLVRVPVDLGELSQKFSEGLHKMTEQFKKVGAVISEGAKTIAVVLPNIMMPGEYRVIRTSESDPMAGLTMEKVPPVNLLTRERELLQAIFGKLEDVARDTTIGTAHITSTSEGIGGISADIVLIDEVASSDPKFGDAEFNQFKYVDNPGSPLNWS